MSRGITLNNGKSIKAYYTCSPRECKKRTSRTWHDTHSTDHWDL